MKIAYILPNYCLIDGNGGGVRVQAAQWADYMRKSGHEVEEIGVWGGYDWRSFDVIQFFYFGFVYIPLYDALKSKAPKAKFVCAPILDPHKSILVYKILSFICFPKIKLWTEFSILRYYKNVFDMFLVRSEFEKQYLVKSFGIDEKKIELIPLNSRLDAIDYCRVVKKKFCLHVSRICDPTKNVEKLVDASLKYGFDLVLAGSSTDEFNEKLKRKIGGRNNVKILGKISDENLIDLYREAKVFALPSTREGVGLAALEAASYGCDIVITNIGGPKEYFLPNAISVNPNSVDEIGKAVMCFLDGKTFQPELSSCIEKKYSKKIITKALVAAYQRIV